MKFLIRLLSVLFLTLAFVASAFSAAPADGDTKVQLRGDVNGDGACSLADVLGILRRSAGGENLSQYAADIDGNGAVNLRDALLLLARCLSPAAPMPSRTLTYLSKSSYAEKTEAGFLGQLVGMISGYEFMKTEDGRQYVGMPDEWYAICAGPYGAKNTHLYHSVKRVYNEESNLWEIWLDDDFSVDIVNQYAIADSFFESGAFSARYIGEAWRKYDVYDMGGGNRYAGAYYLLNKYRYITPFAGSEEFGNKYSFLTEPYLGADTVGLNLPGMPETAQAVAATCGSVTGDRDNVEWTRMFAAMQSLAYFETDIPTLIRKAARVFPADSFEKSVVDLAFSLYQTYPDDWRTAYRALEAVYYVDGVTRQTNNSINCGFVILDLLYGGGDYDTTCKIGSLAGYDCESTCGIALTVLGIMEGRAALPEEVNTYVWQNGEGVLVNLPVPGTAEDVWMVALGLPERIRIADLLDLYRTNFESFLLRYGGEITDDGYWIPAEALCTPESVLLVNGSFESDTLDGFTVEDTAAQLCDLAVYGRQGLKLTGRGRIYQNVAVESGKTYRLSVFGRASDGSVAFLYVKNGDETPAVSFRSTENFTTFDAQKAVPRTLTFTAKADDVEIGFAFLPVSTDRETFAVLDEFRLRRVEEERAGSVALSTDAQGRRTVTVTSGALGEEVYLRLYYKNSGTIFAVGNLSRDGLDRGSVCFSKVGTAAHFGQTEFTAYDSVLLPLTVEAAQSTYTVEMLKGAVTITGGELVRVKDRF